MGEGSLLLLQRIVGMREKSLNLRMSGLTVIPAKTGISTDSRVEWAIRTASNEWLNSRENGIIIRLQPLSKWCTLRILRDAKKIRLFFLSALKEPVYIRQSQTTIIGNSSLCTISQNRTTNICVFTFLLSLKFWGTILGKLVEAVKAAAILAFRLLDNHFERASNCSMSEEKEDLSESSSADWACNWQWEQRKGSFEPWSLARAVLDRPAQPLCSYR